MCGCVLCSVFFFKQKTAYEMRISDWSSDVCSSDLYTLHDRTDGFGKRFCDLALIDGNFLGDAIHQVTALDVDGFTHAVGGRLGNAILLLDSLGRCFTDEQVVMAADIGDDGFVHLVAAHAH